MNQPNEEKKIEKPGEKPSVISTVGAVVSDPLDPIDETKGTLSCALLLVKLSACMDACFDDDD